MGPRRATSGFPGGLGLDDVAHGGHGGGRGEDARGGVEAGVDQGLQLQLVVVHGRLGQEVVQRVEVGEAVELRDLLSFNYCRSHHTLDIESRAYHSLLLLRRLSLVCSVEEKVDGQWLHLVAVVVVVVVHLVVTAVASVLLLLLLIAIAESADHVGQWLKNDIRGYLLLLGSLCLLHCCPLRSTDND